MTALYQVRPAPFGATTLYYVINGVDQLMLSIRSFVVARGMRRDLEALSPEQLDDIGLTRFDIDAAVAKVSRWA